MFLTRSSVLGALVAAAASLLTAIPASAQQPGYGAPPYSTVTKFDRANAGVAVAGSYAAVPLPLVPPPVYWTAAPKPSPYTALVVTVTAPRQVSPLLVDVRDPDGVVRTYPVARGLAGIETRQVIVHQGETASFRFATAAVAPK